MKISKKLVQFEKNSTAIIVAGTLEADFYLAFKGEINKKATFAVKKSHYSDKENFGRRGNVVFESGDKAGIMKKFLHQEFVKNFKVNLKSVTAAKSAYLFAPDSVVGDLKKVLPQKWGKALKTIKGNFGKQHVFELLEKIK